MKNKIDISFNSLMKKVNGETFAALELLLPKNRSNFLRSISSFNSTNSDFIQIDERSYKALSIPLWEILQRNGKGWRSYILQVSCEAAGHQFTEFKNWLALPEIIHVGSLIIDDIQDSSKIRRGGMACHLIYGIGPAINSGTFAYFIGQKLIEKTALDNRKKLAIYQEYMTLLREAHIGQGLDIVGLDLVLADIGTNPDALVDAVMDIHWRKSGVVFGSFSRMGAILGSGSALQIRMLGEFFGEIGTLFQVHDDIINVTGFQQNLKQQFEDLEHRKITLPIAIALQNLSANTRKQLIQQLANKNCDPKLLNQNLIEAINISNSIQLCEALIEKRYYNALDKLHHSQCKISNIEHITMFARKILDIDY